MTNFNSEPVLQNSGLLSKYLSITFIILADITFYLSSGKNINKILSWRNFWYVVDLRQNDPIEHSYLILHNIITILYRPGHLISPEWSWCVGFSTVHHPCCCWWGLCCYEVVRFAASKARFRCSPILGGDYCPQRRHLCYPGFQPCMGRGLQGQVRWLLAEQHIVTGRRVCGKERCVDGERRMWN